MNLGHAILFATVAAVAAAAEPKALYQQDFSQTDTGKVPDQLLVLDGLFAVKEDAGNKFLELPGAPLETFGILFGPSEGAGVQVSARIFGTRQGRKFPTFSAGLNGVGGFKVHVAPAKRALELTKGDDLKSSSPFDWQSGQWTTLKLQVKKLDRGLRVQAKAWQGSVEPKEWMLTFDEPEELPAGRAGVWGMPFSGTVIRFDDLKVAPAE